MFKSFERQEALIRRIRTLPINGFRTTRRKYLNISINYYMMDNGTLNALKEMMEEKKRKTF